MRRITDFTGKMGNQMFQFAYLHNQMRKGLIHDTFVQKEDYFIESADEIKALFRDGIGYTDKVAIHVRRGDYLKPPHNQFHTNFCDTDYFERAIKYFQNDKFLVFCADDQSAEGNQKDKEWCIEYFTKLLGDRFEWFENVDAVTNFNAMASCKSQIIANSSFSWWAAYLNPNPHKIIIAPKETSWFYDGIIRTWLPKTWIQI